MAMMLSAGEQSSYSFVADETLKALAGEVPEKHADWETQTREQPGKALSLLEATKSS